MGRLLQLDFRGVSVGSRLHPFKKRLSPGSFLRPTQKTGPGNKKTATKHVNFWTRQWDDSFRWISEVFQLGRGCIHLQAGLEGSGSVFKKIFSLDASFGLLATASASAPALFLDSALCCVV